MTSDAGDLPARLRLLTIDDYNSQQNSHAVSGQDWRSPGWSWMKTEDGWKRCEFPCDDFERNNFNLHL
ncbi:unnamed protein product [Ranitomeya imitator]|uniref:Uncharacterized protein n=1 Tax=Ranitomeya imitator TaxID=111125 RepID=A0ABN9MHD5_9NEOB|nr:unnamed protein product [Ranitomeya imitator]